MINNQGLPLALAQSFARAATVCDGYLVLVMDRTIEIFSVSDFTNGGTSGDVKPISSIPLYTPASNIRRAIAKAAFQIRGDESGVLHLSMRGNFGTLNIASLFRESDSAGGAPSFDRFSPWARRLPTRLISLWFTTAGPVFSTSSSSKSRKPEPPKFRDNGRIFRQCVTLMGRIFRCGSSLPVSTSTTRQVWFYLAHRRGRSLLRIFKRTLH